MTFERIRFPLGLTLAAVVVFLICCGLGAWQVQRGAWKAQELARIAALQHAAPVPVAPVLQRLAGGAEVTFTRVVADCAPAPPAPGIFRMMPDNGDWVARAVSPCALAAGPYDGVMVDRGFFTASRGAVTPPVATLPAPVHVVGVLFPHGEFAPSSLRHPAPAILVAETETPPPPGIAPAAYPGATADQLQYVGAYAVTWFGLAGALACFYAAMLWRRYHPKR
jgi:surfeit locus 1 family protein